MDPRSSAQDVHRCDLCETAFVHSYCDFCHVNLCRPCILDHILDGYDKHKIVPFNERRSTLIYPKCETHPNKICKFQCQNCSNIFVCSFCTASEQHRGHVFEEVAKIYKTKKESIEKDAESLKHLVSVKYEGIALNLENQIANLDEEYQKITSKISSLGDEWHREIDIVINKMKTEIIEIQIKHKDVLQKNLDEIKHMQSLIKQTIMAIKTIEESTEVSQTIEYSSKLEKFTKPPQVVCVTMPTFITKPMDREKLYNLFGQIKPLATATEENFISLNQPNTSLKKLLDEPEIVSTIPTGYDCLLSVTFHHEDRIWLSGRINKIICINIKGSLLQTIQTNSDGWLNDIAVDSDGDLLYSDVTTRTVRKVKNGQIKELIRLPEEWAPVNLCVTSTGDILVAICKDDWTQSKVVRYSGSTEKQTIQYDNDGKPLYSGHFDSKYISENRNLDICVSDVDAGAVVVVNQYGELRWRYTGHPSATKNEPFRPWGITIDSQSRILTADSNNHCIYILDQNGQFLHYFDNCDLTNPFCLCVDNNDNLYVCDYSCKITKIKYLK